MAALAAGGSFAAAGVLQQRAASRRPEGEALSFRLIFDLAHDRSWLLGIAFALLSYVLESIALSFGPLVLVQPLIVTELLFALPASMRWHHTRMSLQVWLGTIAIALGLSLGLALAAPGEGRPGAPALEWIVALAIVAGLTMFAVAGGRRAKGPLRSSLYALGAGLVLGTQAALLKATIARFQQGPASGFSSWELWCMVLCSILGLLLVQSAYEAGPLAASMPVVDAVDPVVAIVFGIALFDERIHTGLRLVGVVGGLVLLLTGIVLLDTSSVVRRLQKLERGGRESRPEEGEESQETTVTH